MFKLRKTLTNQRPPSTTQLEVEVQCKGIGKIQLTRAAMNLCNLSANDRLIVEEFEGENESIFAIRKSETDKGSIISEKGLLSATNAWTALGGVKLNGELITNLDETSLDPNAGEYTQTIYTLLPAVEAEIEEGVTVTVFPLSFKENRVFEPRTFSKTEDTVEEVVTPKKGKKSTETETDEFGN